MLNAASHTPNPYAVPMLLAAIAIVALGLVVLIRERSSRVSIRFFLMTLPSGLWLYAFSRMYGAATEPIAFWWAKVAYLGVPLIPPATYHFSVAVLRIAHRHRRRLWWCWGVAAGFAAVILTTDALFRDLYHYPWGYYPHYRWLSVPYLCFFLGVMVSTLRLYWSAYRRAIHGSVHQRRVQAFLIGFTIATFACVDYLAKFGMPIYPFGYLGVLGFLLIAAHAIWRYHLVDLTPAFAANEILKTMQGAVLVTDLEGCIRISNHAAQTLLGYRRSELIGQPLTAAIAQSAQRLLDPHRLIRAGPRQEVEMQWRTKHGRAIDVDVSIAIVPDRDRQPAGLVYVAHDVTQRKLAEQQAKELAATEAAAAADRARAEQLAASNQQLTQVNADLAREIDERQRTEQALQALTAQLTAANLTLEQLALIDPLTELLNRRGLQRALSREIEWARREDSTLLALLIDLDDFKSINDTLGHVVGDGVLKELARKLQASLRVTDHVARVGGDEFLILLPHTRFAEGTQVAEKVRLAISGMPIPISAGNTVKVTASFGLISVSPTTPSIDELLSQAYTILHRSKHTGKNRVSCARGQRGLARSRQEVLAILQSGDQLHVLMQPILRLDDHLTVGYECLSRLPLASGFPLPDDFFRLCLEANMLTLVDHQCLTTCIAATTHLPPGMRRHLNLFPSTLMNIPVHHLLEAFPSDQPPGTFCVELSEQQIIGEPSYLIEPVTALKRAGILVAIDDVGFGRSSLESLILLEPDIVKIDKKCVYRMAEDLARTRALKRLLRVADVLGTEVVAEGIELSDDFELLRTLGVRYGQGFLFGKPVECESLVPA